MAKAHDSIDKCILQHESGSKKYAAGGKVSLMDEMREKSPRDIRATKEYDELRKRRQSPLLKDKEYVAQRRLYKETLERQHKKAAKHAKRKQGLDRVAKEVLGAAEKMSWERASKKPLHPSIAEAVKAVAKFGTKKKDKAKSKEYDTPAIQKQRYEESLKSK